MRIIGFTIEPECMSEICRVRQRLKGVSAERIRDEMFKIFESGNATECLRALDKRGILENCISRNQGYETPQKAGKARINIWKHTMDTVAELEALCRRLRRNTDAFSYIHGRQAGNRSVYALLKIAALLHDAGKPVTFKYKDGRVSFYGHERIGSRMAGHIAGRLRLSRDEQRWLSKVIFLHLRPGYMATMPAVTGRAIFRFFRDAGGQTPAVLLLSLADERATTEYDAVIKIRPRYERLIFRLMRLYFNGQKKSRKDV